jgi:hypothetical protein
MPAEMKLPHHETYKFGLGIDRVSGIAMNLVVEPTQTDPERAPGAQQSFKVSRVSSTEDLQQSLGIDIKASYGAASFGAGVSAQFSFATSSSVHKASLFLTITATIHFADESIGEVKLTQEAGSMIDNPQRFADRYGDMFLRARKRGGLFVGLLHVETFDETDASDIEGELQGSYGLFSADAKMKFQSVMTKHNASVYCTVYAEGGPAIQIKDPTDPDGLLEQANTWMREMHDHPDENAVPYEWTAAPVTIAEGPLAPNSADLEHAQDVLQFCAQQRAELLDQLNLLNWWARHEDKYDWTDADPPEVIVKKAGLTQEDLDLISDCASHAIDHPGAAKMPADFAPTATPPTTYPQSLPLPKGPKAKPGTPPLVKLPDFTKIPRGDGPIRAISQLAAAEQEVERLGLHCNLINASGLPRGMAWVTAQAPPPGTEVQVGDTVTLTS